MSSNLRVNNIFPSVGTNVAIGTAGGSITLTGSVTGSDLTLTGGINATGVLTATTFSGNLTGNVNSTGVTTVTTLNIGTGTSISSPSSNVLTLGTNSVERVRIDSSGNVGINTANPQDKLTVLGKIHVHQDSGSENRIILRGQPSSSYRWNIDNYSSSNTFRIYREDDATSASGAVAMSIDASTRNVTISGGNLAFDSGKGIDFSANSNAAGMTSELLDDYEIGTWTPSITDGYTRTYANRQGRYIKIGSLVYVFGQISGNGRSGAAGSYAYIALPYGANLMGQIQQPLTIMQTYNITHTSLITGAAQWDAPTELRIYETTTNANSNYLSPSNIPASFELGFFYVYYTTS